ncbi:MAG: transposase [Parasutterella sp.]
MPANSNDSGLGPICSCRLRATIGDIRRFKNPKDFPAYYGLVPSTLLRGTTRRKEKSPIVGTKQ